MLKFVAVFSSVCLVCVLVGLALYQRMTGSGFAYRVLDAPAVVKEVRQLNELVTVRYGIEKVVGIKEDRSPVGSESILILVQGKVLAGIDLAALQAGDVTVAARDSIRIGLPTPHIQEAFLDEKYTKVWDRSVTWWTPWVSPDINLEHKARMQALDDIRQAALDMGILADAKRSAERDIRGLLRAFGIEHVAFDYGT